MVQHAWLRTLMKKTRAGTHSLVESVASLPARQRLLELNGHSPRRSNL